MNHTMNTALQSVNVSYEGRVASIVADFGSGSTKAGLGGENAPRVEESTLVCEPRKVGLTGPMFGSKYDTSIGNEANSLKGLMRNSSPISRGVISDWIAMEKFMHLLFYRSLKTCPEEHPFLLTGAVYSNRESKEKTAQLMFELFNAPAIVLTDASVMALYSSGNSSGVVIDSGYGQTRVVPIWEGYCIKHSVQECKLGGKDVTSQLMRLLRKEGYDMSSQSDEMHVERIKELHGYVAQDIKAEMAYANRSHKIERTYLMPDGSPILCNHARFLAPEILFDPTLIFSTKQDVLFPHSVSDEYQNFPGLHIFVKNALLHCDEATQTHLYSTIVLGGGNTLFPNVRERLIAEISSLTDRKVCITSKPDRRFATWVGSSVLASIDTFPSMWMNKNEYFECGAGYIHSNCLN